MTARSACRPELAAAAALLLALGCGPIACGERVDEALPLLVMAGPDNFTSFEMRSSTGTVIWRLEADRPSQIPHLVYAEVPRGFRQVHPSAGPPRPLTIGEDLVLESRIPDRVFVHRAFATTATTIAIQSSEMRRSVSAP